MNYGTYGSGVALFWQVHLKLFECPSVYSIKVKSDVEVPHACMHTQYVQTYTMIALYSYLETQQT